MEFLKKEIPIRVVTAASLFDGHDASINIVRRILQANGVEVIHLGHNRSAFEIVFAAICEDTQAIAVSSYQGGHNEFFPYLRKLLDENYAASIKIFGGGGGVIVPSEIQELESKGIEKIYSPEEGRSLGLEGMIKDLIDRIQRSNFLSDYLTEQILNSSFLNNNFRFIARGLTLIENRIPIQQFPKKKHCTVIGITGTGGSGKSCLLDEIIRRLNFSFPKKKYAILSIDPTKRKSGGALLGDRIRMNSIYKENIYMRSIATRESDKSINSTIKEMIEFLKSFEFDLIFIETAGIGQSDSSIVDFVDFSIYVMTPEYGAPTQLEKINMMDYADMIVINKFDKMGSLDALREVRKQYRRSRNVSYLEDDELPIYGTIASKFNDPATDYLFSRFIQHLNKKFNLNLETKDSIKVFYPNKNPIIPENRLHYLEEIKKTIENYHKKTKDRAEILSKIYKIQGTIQYLKETQKYEFANLLEKEYQILIQKIPIEEFENIKKWEETKEKYIKKEKEILPPLYEESLSHLKIPRISTPKYKDWGDIYEFLRKENFPGEFPYTAGVFPFKRTDEDPTRMFAGEGTPERTNKRFHYLCKDLNFSRLSTAFDSVTLYGEDPDYRPDIYGKIGNAGVSICTLDDMKKLYAGFDLCNSNTSVSMTINGPAPILLAMFFNTAIDQQIEKYLLQIGESKKLQKHESVNIHLPHYKRAIIANDQLFGYGTIGIRGEELIEREVYEKIKKDTLKKIRGTVQSDILKEDQAQNTCIFSIEFALRMMGDVQEYYIQNQIKNHYSVSISGYHIAEAGANPITQLAFTLANGFTYIEYFLSRGMKIDEFAPNLSFFFSNGMDPEYSVIGRTARRIWAIAMKYYYNANEKSQKLKYHIQTSGRSLHAMEIDFNDIRTTLQALLAILDRCNSLHTNAYDEAITTPTEESVRRAMAIQLIINKEFGFNKNDNPMQGSFFIEELTDLVEEAVLKEFLSISQRGGVLGAMELMYQRSKIQEESLYYEELKHSKKIPIIGVNTFINPNSTKENLKVELIRSTTEEKEEQIKNLKKFFKRNEPYVKEKLNLLKRVAKNQPGNIPYNIFEELMETVKYCSLGQITNSLYDIGGQYRRNL
ncbi:MAG: methylmalonyl-CoA mutase family protein [Leptonema sp. (in: bacteria)]